MINYSIVVPFHNEEENLPELYRRLTLVMERLDEDYELVFLTLLLWLLSLVGSVR